jgi:hypothetical protein
MESVDYSKRMFVGFNPLSIENESGVKVLSPLKPIGQ